MFIAFVAGAVLVWFGQALGLSCLMNRRGFHPLPWFVMPLLMGPMAWPLALFEALSGPPRQELVRRGSRGPGALNVFVLLDRDELPEQFGARVARLMPDCHRLVLGRVIKAGGPRDISRDAESFLRRIGRNMWAGDAEIRILFGDMRRAVQTIDEEGVFGVVLRGDQLDGLPDSDGETQKVRCLRDVTAPGLILR
ncbi:MAG: hypothetical protein ACRDK3_08450 [Actinomycetota bacterium]